MSFDQNIIFFSSLLNVPHSMPDRFAKHQEARIFFLLKKKIVLLQKLFLRFSSFG